MDRHQKSCDFPAFGMEIPPKKLYVEKSMEMSFFPFMPLKQAPVPGPDNRDFLQLDNAMIISIS
jgi:hypothetical protein